jgi:hypothetical protein
MAHAQAYITGALNGPGGKAQFFLSDGTYIRYDVAADRADPGYPKPVTDRTWPGMGRYGRHAAGSAAPRPRAPAQLTVERPGLKFRVTFSAHDPRFTIEGRADVAQG